MHNAVLLILIDFIRKITILGYLICLKLCQVVRNCANIYLILPHEKETITTNGPIVVFCYNDGLRKNTVF